MEITLNINGKTLHLNVKPSETLLDVVRRLGYTSVKYGCGQGFCGACTVIMNGRPLNSCLVLAATADGKEVITVEHLGNAQKPHPIQEAFVEAGAVQCGFCTPGMILSAKALLDKDPSPSDADIKKALDGNLCRCTGYVQIIEAVRSAARRIRQYRRKKSKKSR